MGINKTRIKQKYNVVLPRGYLSYSAYILWKKDKEGFRRKYYENEKPFETVETIFGKKIAKMLEENEGIITLADGTQKKIRSHDIMEKRIEVSLNGIPLMGYLDSFCNERKAIIEYKTGHLSKDGKVPWDRIKVLKHKQLDFYSLLIELKYGDVDPNCWLIWLETKFQKDTREFAGHKLEAQTRRLELSGNVLEFPRIIYKYERENIKKDIIKVALEIHEDYEKYNAKRS